MGADYIPERDHRAGCWMKFFAAGLAEQPELFHSTPAEAAEIAQRVHAFRTALRIARSPSTATRPNTARKNAARRLAEQLIRPAAQRVRTDPTIPAELKINMGIKPGGPRRRRVGPPESSPVLRAVTELSGFVRIDVRDSASGKRAKPDGVAELRLYKRVCPRDTDPALRDSLPWTFAGSYSRWPIQFLPNIEAPGDEVSIVASWVTRRREEGPDSQVISVLPHFNRGPRMTGLDGGNSSLAA